MCDVRDTVSLLAPKSLAARRLTLPHAQVKHVWFVTQRLWHGGDGQVWSCDIICEGGESGDGARRFTRQFLFSFALQGSNQFRLFRIMLRASTTPQFFVKYLGVWLVLVSSFFFVLICMLCNSSTSLWQNLYSCVENLVHFYFCCRPCIFCKLCWGFLECLYGG